MSNRQHQRESLIESIVAQVTREIENVLNATEMSGEARAKITNDVVSNTERIIDSCTLDELESSSAFERHLERCVVEAKMHIHQLRSNERRK